MSQPFHIRPCFKGFLFICLLMISCLLKAFPVYLMQSTHIAQRLMFEHTFASYPIVKLEQDGCDERKHNTVRVTFGNGVRACAKIAETDRELRGELYTYYLSRYLGLNKVPPVKLDRIDYSQARWANVTLPDSRKGWRNGRQVVLSLYIDDLEPERAPLYFRQNTTDIVGLKAYSEMPGDEQAQLMEWSSMIVLDFLSGQSDRLVAQQINYKTNKHVYAYAVDNLYKTKTLGLVLLDNDTAFGLGYRFAEEEEFHDKHYARINQLCVFDDDLVESIAHLYQQEQPIKTLEAFIETYDQESLRLLSPLPLKDQRAFKQRLQYLRVHMRACGYSR